jgi:hypothetical protein
VQDLPQDTNPWDGNAEFETIYARLGLAVPTERIHLLRRRKKSNFLPDYNAGMIGFHELTADGRRFADLWNETALAIGRMDDIPHRRP